MGQDSKAIQSKQALGIVDRRHWRCRLAATLALGALGAMGTAFHANAVGTLVDVTLVDRDAASVLDAYAHRGRHYVAGRPGARYAIRVTNRTGERVLAVMSVDGVNIVTGQTAAWNQGGYVLQPWASHEITGWRKSPHEVAAFEFAALPDSYAALTGRPSDVGVIGVAVFNERIVAPLQLQPLAPQLGRADGQGTPQASGAAREADRGEPAAKAAAPENSTGAADAARAPLRERTERLGTAHGARENSYASTTTFVRRSSRPAEQVSLFYDRYENLARAGVFAPPAVLSPTPFPLSRNAGYVPDPPLR
jgi:hypothetical protein